MRRAWVTRFSTAGLILACLAPAAVADEARPGRDSEGSYVVRKGDTLWGIARERLQDPFRWPMIWERNPFIADPNLIFPGDSLLLPGVVPAEAAAAAPPPVEAGALAPAPAGAAPSSGPVLPSAAEAPAVSPPAPAKVKDTPSPPPEAELTEAVGAAAAPVPAASPAAIACSPILAADAPGIGEVVQSYDHRLLLSQENRVFLGLKAGSGVRVGDQLAAVRPGQLIAHPVTGRTIGRIVDTLGVMEVLEVRDRVALAIIRNACDAIEIGNPIIPFSPAALPEAAPVPAARSLEGMIVGASRLEQIVALQQMVFLDLGGTQGVAVGDIFAIYRPNLPAVTPTGAYPIPPERLGEAIVVRVTERTATAVITASPKESRVGDRAVLSQQAKP
jgi:hypothetical protein